RRDIERRVGGARGSRWSNRHAWRLRQGRGGRRSTGPATERGSGGGGIGHERENGTPLADTVADLDFQLGHDARERRGHIHGGFVGFERYERLFRRDAVARLDHD